MIELCSHYTTTGFPAFKPKCLKGRRASLKCHKRDCKCPKYTVAGGHTISMVILDEHADYPTFPVSEIENSPTSTRE